MINIQKISLSDLIVQTDGIVGSDMGEEKVLMSIDNGKYYNLGDIGGVIWDKLKTPLTVQELINFLIEQYEIEKVECEKQVISFLEMLNKENLIRVGN